MKASKILKQYGVDPIWSDLEFNGVDASLDVSLFEYGLVWALDRRGYYRFVYTHPYDSGAKKIVTDWAVVSGDQDVETGWAWVDYDALCQMLGVSIDAWRQRSLPFKIFDIYCAHGFLNVFGAPNYPKTFNASTYYVAGVEFDSREEAEQYRNVFHPSTSVEWENDVTGKFGSYPVFTETGVCDMPNLSWREMRALLEIAEAALRSEDGASIIKKELGLSDPYLAKASELLKITTA